jgi:hypothetical protein
MQAGELPSLNILFDSADSRTLFLNHYDRLKRGASILLRTTELEELVVDTQSD